jgi:hopanoid biosynthesis associated protein HpnK
MVGAPAASDAVARARRLPQLRVGLHVNLVEGAPVLPPERVPDLVGRNGRFDENMLRAGCRFFFLARARRQLADEIRAQFAAFQASGLALDHANAHRHMHVHPTVAGLILRIGREFGLRALRIPDEPVRVLKHAAATEGGRVQRPLHAPWIALLRRRSRRSGLSVNDHLLGIAWTGAMTEDRVLRLLAALPAGTSELYCHPAVAQTPRLRATMPHYRPVEELAALTSPRVRAAIERQGIELVSYADLSAAA